LNLRRREIQINRRDLHWLRRVLAAHLDIASVHRAVEAWFIAGPRALISAFTFPVTVVPGVRAMPEDAASFAISAIETLLAFRLTFNCAGVSFELTVPLMNSGVGPSLIVVFANGQQICQELIGDIVLRRDRIAEVNAMNFRILNIGFGRLR